MDSGCIKVRRGVFAAATLVFLAGSARTEGVSGSFRGGWGRILGLFCEIGGLSEIRQGREVVLYAFPLETAFAVLSAFGGADDLFCVGDAEIGEVESVGEDLVAREAVGLEAAEFSGRL